MAETRVRIPVAVLRKPSEFWGLFSFLRLRRNDYEGASVLHIATLIPRLRSQTFAGQDVKNPTTIPICVSSQ
jgi:hypothetical protein